VNQRVKSIAQEPLRPCDAPIRHFGFLDVHTSCPHAQC
jgi:hypothetical protein